MPNNKIKNIY